MRPLLHIAAILLAAGCATILAASAARASVCGNDSTGLVALTDLGAGSYGGFQGGLYAGGSNHRPPAHDAAGVAIAHAMAPLDTLGQPDAVTGRFVLISIGMSNCTQEFSAFVPKAMTDPQRHPQLTLIDCAKGGQATQDVRLASAAYWDTVDTRLRGRGSSPLQPQAVWIKQARRSPGEPFPASAESLTNDLGAIVRIIRQRLPNVKLVYFTSRIYAGYASSALNPEPYAYEAGFATRWLVDAQVSGVDSLNFDPGAGPVHAPWLAWGPYLWADGLEGRADGMTWRCDQFNSDGTHPSSSGRIVVADSLLAFFKHDHTTVPWFVNPSALAVGPSHGAAPRLALSPNPVTDRVHAAFRVASGVSWRLDAFDTSGRRVAALGAGRGDGGEVTRAWSLRDTRGARVPAGVYWVRLIAGGQVSSARAAVVAGR